MLTSYTKMQSVDSKMYPFHNKMHREPIRLLFCSFGKDSLATVLLAIQHHEPLDAVVNVREWYDKSRNITLLHPEHEQWIQDTAIPFIQEHGIPYIQLESECDFLELFHRHVTRGKNWGKMRGYPLEHACYIQRDIKMKAVHSYLRPINRAIQYIGIAWDEKERAQRMAKAGKVSLMVKYKVTEKQAYTMCEQSGLLSPLYQHAPRTGCFLCPNQNFKQLAYIKESMPELYDEWLHLHEDSEYYVYHDIKQKYTNIELDRKVTESMQ